MMSSAREDYPLQFYPTYRYYVIFCSRRLASEWYLIHVMTNRQAFPLLVLFSGYDPGLGEGCD